jgi:PST family polysaccharide transporter
MPLIHGSLRAVLANSGWLLLDRLFRIAISVLVGAWVARHLGPARYGELAYVLALLALFQSGCSLGLDGPIVRDISRDMPSSGLILGSGVGLRVAAGAAGWATAMLAVVTMRPGDMTALAMVSIAGATLVFQPAEMVDLWMQSQGRSRLIVPYRLVAYCVVALGKVGLILADAPAWVFAGAALADAALVAVALSFAYRAWPSPSRWRWGWITAMRLLQESWPLMLAAVSVGIYMRIDQIMLRELASERQLGLYSAAIPFSQGWHLIPFTIYASILPRLSQLQAQATEMYHIRLQQTITLMTWAGIAAAGVTAACAPWLVPALLGEKYVETVAVLQWHGITNIFVFMGVAQSLAIVSENTPRLQLTKTLVGVMVSIGANYLLIPRWGAVGAAWAAALSYGSSAMLSNVVLAPSAFRMQLRAFNPFHEKTS